MKNPYKLPPVRETAEGKTRRLGVEIEFAGLRIEKISSVLQDTVGGNIRLVSPYEHKIVDTPYGDFVIELDYNFLLALGRKEDQIDLPESLSDFKDFSEDLLSAVARFFVPFEVVTPPLPIDDIAWLDELGAKLQAAGALGTRSSLLYGFGLHLNMELPALDVETVLRYFRAFLVSYAWLKEMDETDLTRQIAPHIQPFSKDYVRKVLSSAYAPDMDQFIDDYLEDNPSRNRALDMLPLLSHIDRQRVLKVVKDELVNPRPTFHYRLPNCEIDDPEWSVSDSWNHWVQVEELAEDRARLDESREAYLKYLKNPVAGLFGDWAKRSEKWLAVPSSA